MPRAPSFYAKSGWYVSSAGGVQHQKLCRVSEGTKTAKIALARLIVLLADSPQRKPKGLCPLIAEAYDEFLDMKKVETAPETFEWYRQKLDAFFKMFANRETRSLEYADGLAFKKSLMAKGHANGYINAQLRAAKTLLNWIAKPSRRKKFLVSENPFEEIVYLKETPRQRLITDAEMTFLLNECRDGNVVGGAEDFREQVFTLRYSTMRPGELRHLKWEYINWDQNRIVYPPEVIKTRNRREITLIQQTKELLLARKQRLDEVRSHRPGPKQELSGYVFSKPGRDTNGQISALCPSGRLMKSRSLTNRWRRMFLRCVDKGLIQKEKEGETIVPYNTRHSRITELVLEGHPTAVVMAEAGHSTQVTTQRYTHLAGSVVAERVRAADDKRERDKADVQPK